MKKAGILLSFLVGMNFVSAQEKPVSEIQADLSIVNKQPTILIEKEQYFCIGAGIGLFIVIQMFISEEMAMILRFII
jgi:hypothetical protein